MGVGTAVGFSTVGTGKPCSFAAYVRPPKMTRNTIAVTSAFTKRLENDSRLPMRSTTNTTAAAIRTGCSHF